MRVITGVARGRPLKCVPGRAVRPTADRVKESLFSAWQYRVDDAVFLDCFAGSGAVGIEALSRGARRVVFIERAGAHVKVIRENLAACGFSDHPGVEILTMDYLAALDLLTRREERFDLIFIDPPYRQDLIPPALERIARGGLLAPTGVLVAERDKRDPLPERVAGGSLYLVRSRDSTFGETVLSWYQPQNPAEGGAADGAGNLPG
jgi:16S rRNA (guanine966-N2)-methyltransferase